MNKKKRANRSRVLFRYEMKHMLIFFVLGMIASLVVVGEVFGSLHYLLSPVRGVGVNSYSAAGNLVSGSIFGYILIEVLRNTVCLCVVAFAVMAMVQFADLQKRNQREYLNSLPFTQKEKFFAKVLVSYSMITVWCLVIGVGVLVQKFYFEPIIIKNNVLSPFFHQFAGADTLFHTIRSLLLFWLTLLAMYSVYMLVAYLIRNSIFSAIVGAGALFWPLGLVTVGWYISVSMSPFLQSGKADVILNCLKRYFGMFEGRTLGYRYGYFSVMGYFSNSDYSPKGAEYLPNRTAVLSYGNIWISFGLAAAILVGCTWLAWWINQKQDLARINSRIPTAIGRVGINIGISTSLGAFATYFLNDYLISNATSHVSWTRCLVLWLLISGSFYLLFHLTKIWKRV